MEYSNSKLRFVISLVQGYNPEKYWRMRSYVIQKEGSKLIKYYYLYRIKKMDAFNGSSLGTQIGVGAEFKSIPHFPHGIRGIFISRNARVGETVTIFHQVTIGEGENGAPEIGDNVYMGARG